MANSASFSESYRSLAAAQKGRARSAPAYSVYVNRPWGRVLAAAGHTVGMTPNQASFISISCSLLGMATLIFFPPSLLTGIITAFLLAFGYAWDSSDGQLARLRGGGSRQGEWLDHVLDSFKNIALHLSVAIGMYRWFDLQHPILLLIPLVFATAATVSFAAMLLNDLLAGKSRPKQAAQSGISVRSLLNLPVDYGTVCWVFVLWGWPHLFLVAYGLLALAAAAFCVLACVKWFRDMGAAPAEQSAS